MCSSDLTRVRIAVYINLTRDKGRRKTVCYCGEARRRILSLANWDNLSLPCPLKISVIM